MLSTARAAKTCASTGNTAQPLSLLFIAAAGKILVLRLRRFLRGVTPIARLLRIGIPGRHPRRVLLGSLMIASAYEPARCPWRRRTTESQEWRGSWYKNDRYRQNPQVCPIDGLSHVPSLKAGIILKKKDHSDFEIPVETQKNTLQSSVNSHSHSVTLI